LSSRFFHAIGQYASVIIPKNVSKNKGTGNCFDTGYISGRYGYLIDGKIKIW
jgi:hypothetical protein